MDQRPQEKGTESPRENLSGLRLMQLALSQREPVGGRKTDQRPQEKGTESPRENLSGLRLMQLALSQRVSGKWFPLAGGQGGSLCGGRAGWEPRDPSPGH